MMITVDIWSIIGFAAIIVFMTGVILVVLIKFIILLSNHVYQLMKEKVAAICAADKDRAEEKK